MRVTDFEGRVGAVATAGESAAYRVELNDGRAPVWVYQLKAGSWGVVMIAPDDEPEDALDEMGRSMLLICDVGERYRWHFDRFYPSANVGECRDRMEGLRRAHQAGALSLPEPAVKLW